MSGAERDCVRGDVERVRQQPLVSLDELHQARHQVDVGRDAVHGQVGDGAHAFVRLGVIQVLQRRAQCAVSRAPQDIDLLFAGLRLLQKRRRVAGEVCLERLVLRPLHVQRVDLQSHQLA